MTTPLPDFLTTKEMSALLRVSPKTIIRWAEVGILVSVKIGRSYRFPRQELPFWEKPEKPTREPMVVVKPKPAKSNSRSEVAKRYAELLAGPIRRKPKPP